MALEECPHMAARCPHYNYECDENKSINCHYIINTTGTAANLIASLQAGPPELRKQIDLQLPVLSNFLQSTIEKLQ